MLRIARAGLSPRLFEADRRLAGYGWLSDASAVIASDSDIGAEQSHQATRIRERGMRRFKSVVQAQRFPGVHSAIYNLFNLSRHMLKAGHYRELRQRAFSSWVQVAAA